MAPSDELFPSGSLEQALIVDEEDQELEIPYAAGGVYVTAEGEGEIRLVFDGVPTDSVEVTSPGLYPLAEHEWHEAHRIRVLPRTWHAHLVGQLRSRHEEAEARRGEPDPLSSLGAGGKLLADLLGQHEADVLVDGAQLGDLAGAALAEEARPGARPAPRGRWRRR